MKDLSEIAAVYQSIDAVLEDRRQDALGRENQGDLDRIEARQRLNDQAYFILAWGQLEAEIDEKCRDTIRTQRSKSAWTDRRVWDLLNPDDRRLSGLSFEERAAILLDRDAGTGGTWSKLQNYYALRNQIAHGKLRPERIDVASVIQDFWVIQSNLRT